MKKLAIGCGIVMLLIGVAAVGAGYYLFRQAAGIATQFAELRQVPDIERSIQNRSPFTPPASEELTDAQIEKLLQVQADVRKRIGERMKEFEEKYKVLAGKEDASITDAPALLQAYADLAKVWLDAKRGQVDALNSAGLSLEEYGGSGIRRTAHSECRLSTWISRRSSKRRRKAGCRTHPAGCWERSLLRVPKRTARGSKSSGSSSKPTSRWRRSVSRRPSSRGLTPKPSAKPAWHQAAPYRGHGA